MRLTNYMRDAFIAAVMNDVPEVDYGREFERVVRLVNQEQFEREFPGLLYSVALNSPWFRRSHYHPGIGGFPSAALIGPTEAISSHPRVRECIRDIKEKAEAQRTKRGALKASLRGVAYGATTRAALAKALPEFEKYLPREAARPTSDLPALAGVVAAFTQAGWPAPPATSANT
jgi:hypothetical protein